MDFDADFIEKVRVAMRQLGRLFPLTDEQVEKAEEVYESETDVSFPGMSDPYELFRHGCKSSDMRLVSGGNSTQATDKHVEQSLAMAAREGGEIPEEVREQMTRDRRAAEREAAKSKRDHS